MYQTFITAYAFMLMFNGCVIVVMDTVGGGSLQSPFTNSTVTESQLKGIQPNYYNATNSTGTTYQQIQQQSFNSSNSWFDQLNTGVHNVFNWASMLAQLAFQLLTPFFIYEVFAIIGFPAIGMWMLLSVLAFYAILTAIYYFTGKGL